MTASHLIQFKIRISILILVLAIGISNSRTFEDDVNLNANQKRLLDQFRDRVIRRLPHDYMKEDIYLIKWLRSRHYNLDVAEAQLLNHLEWRTEKRMDTIHQEDWSDMYDTFKYYTEGRDKIGRPIMYFDVSSMDTRAAVVRGKGERLIRYVDRGIDEGCQIVRELSDKYKNMTRGHLFFNMKGFNLVQHFCLQCAPFVIRMLLTYETHYPECVDLIVGVNTASAIETMLAAARPVLSQATKESLRIYGTDRRIWKPILEKDFDFNQLPPAVGGSKIYKGMEDDYDL